jgi:hypothetical protein
VLGYELSEFVAEHNRCPNSSGWFDLENNTKMTF